jgi:hypothetical protein
MVSWRSGVVSRASTKTSLGGVAQRDLDNGHVMFYNCKVETLSGVVVASTTRTMKVMQISILKIARRFVGSDNSFVAYK